MTKIDPKLTEDSKSPENLVQRAIITVTLILASMVLLLWMAWEWDFQGQSLSGIWSRTDRPLFLASIGLISTALPFVSLRWAALFPPEEKSRLSILTMTNLLCIAFIGNLFLPGPVGEGVAAWVLHRKCNVSVGNSLAGLGLSRVLGLGSACTIAGLVYWIAPFTIEPKWGQILVTTSILLGCVALGLIGLVFFPKLPHRLLLSIRQWSWLQWTPIQRLFGLADEILTSLIDTTGRGWKAYTECILWAMTGHAFVASGIYLAVISMGMTADWSAVLFVYSASIAGSVAMFLFPGSAVAWDILFATTLSMTASLPMTVSVAVAVVVRIQQMLVAAAGAALSIVQSKELLAEALAFGQQHLLDKDVQNDA